MCLYFLEQFGSGHSRRTGEEGGLADGGAGGGGGGGALLFFVGVSSSGALGFLFPGVTSGLGGANGVGDEGPRLPLTPPLLLLRNLLCTDDLVSVKLLKSLVGFVLVAPRPLLPLPLGVLASKSLVGESQNLQINKLHVN